MQTSSTLRLYRHPVSGHCHRVELLLSLLGLPYQSIDIEFGKLPAEVTDANRFAQVPVLYDGETAIADSSAILVYLAKQYDASNRWLPSDPRGAAEVARWLSVAAGPLAYGPAAARVTKLFKRPISVEPMHAIATRLFDVLEQELAARPWLAGAQPTLADVAMYAYAARAPEGDFSLAPYPQVRAWLARVEALAGFVPMTKTTMS
jgi:glutathione S-transferase